MALWRLGLRVCLGLTGQRISCVSCFGRCRRVLVLCVSGFVPGWLETCARGVVWRGVCGLWAVLRAGVVSAAAALRFFLNFAVAPADGVEYNETTATRRKP